MVSKSFLYVQCPCGQKSGEIKRDVSDDRGWERSQQALECTHFQVQFDCYTYACWNPFSSRSDEVTFELHGCCKMCKTRLSTARSSAQSFSTPDHKGVLKCSSCNSSVGWAVFHCAHPLLKTICWTAAAVASGGVLGAAAGAVATGACVATSAGVSATVSGGMALCRNAMSSGNAGMWVVGIPIDAPSSEAGRKRACEHEAEALCDQQHRQKKQKQAKVSLGDIWALKTSGASECTARQDGLRAGVEASFTMARTDEKRILRLGDSLRIAEEQTGIDRYMLAGIISRESRGGAALDAKGWGDKGNGFGIMQVDKRSHAVAQEDGPFGAAHIKQGANIFKSMIDKVAAAHPEWTREEQIKGGLAAYNMGVSNVRTISGMDIGSTGNDYSSDVLARAQYYQKHTALPELETE